ncbi:MAG: hypothetical protein K0B87_04315 [Candidatus Syntrophosphaera sp.]|nr:hypothetical protein [Candidatus Syntrophosphaera sp.]
MSKAVSVLFFLLAASLLLAQDRYGAQISYYDSGQPVYFTQCPRTSSSGTYTALGTRFSLQHPVSLLNGFDVYCHAYGGAVSGIQLDVYSLAEGELPEASLLVASVSKDFGDIVWQDWNYFDLSALGLSFAADEEIFLAFSVPNGDPGSVWAGPKLNQTDAPAHSYRYFTEGTETGWVGYAGEFFFSASVEYDAPFHDASAEQIWFNGEMFLLPGTEAAYEADIRNSGGEIETDIPVTLEISLAEGLSSSVVYSNTQYVSSLDPDETAHISSFPSYIYQVPGEYVVTLRAELAGDMDPANNETYLEQRVVNLPATLSYDDGSAEGAWAPNSSGIYFANQFDPPLAPMLVTDLHFYIWPETWPSPGSDMIGMAVFADDGTGAPGTQLFYQEASCVRGAWNSYAIPDAGVVVNGRFFVAFTTLADYPNSPGLAVDRDPPHSGWLVSWTGSGNSWYNAAPEDNMDWMIRATAQSHAFWPPQELAISLDGNDVLLDWADVPDASFYQVYRGNEPENILNRIGPDLTDSEFTDPEAAVEPMSFYRVTATTEELGSPGPLRPASRRGLALLGSLSAAPIPLAD